MTLLIAILAFAGGVFVGNWITCKLVDMEIDEREL